VASIAVQVTPFRPVEPVVVAVVARDRGQGQPVRPLLDLRDRPRPALALLERLVVRQPAEPRPEEGATVVRT
jgi:hypothetical protein